MFTVGDTENGNNIVSFLSQTEILLFFKFFRAVMTACWSHFYDSMLVTFDNGPDGTISTR